MAKMNVIGASVSPPLHPERVGELLGCLETLRRVQGVVNGYIEHLKALHEKDLSAIFSDANILEDHTSKWYGFTHERIDIRLKWFHDDLTPALDRDLTKMDQLLHAFSDFWDKAIGASISPRGKLLIKDVQAAWTAIEWSLENHDPNEPYRVEVLAECQSLLSGLHNVICKMGSWPSELWRVPGWDQGLCETLFQSGFPVYSLEIPERRFRIPDYKSHDNKISLSNTRQPDLEKCPLEGHNQHSRIHSMLPKKFWIKEFWLVMVCLITAVIYSAVTHDVQTGFTIAGVLLGSGNVLLLAIAYNGRTRKIALE